MGQLITSFVSADVLTMSSRDIAEMVVSRHDKVKQSIERLAKAGVIQLPPLGDVVNHQGQTVAEYLFSGEDGKRDSIIVIAQLSPPHTAKLVDRWRELEANLQGKIAEALPKDYQSALRALADSVDRAQHLAMRAASAEVKAAELEHHVDVIAPKAAIYDRYLNAEGLMCLQDLGRALGQKPNKFIDRLEGPYLFRQSGVLKPHGRFVEMGIFKFEEKLRQDKLRGQTMATPKAVIYFAKKLNAQGQVMTV